MGEPHVVSALVRKRSELAGEIAAAEKRLVQLRADLSHVDAVLRLFDADAEPEAIRPKLPRRRTRWFADGELPRRVLDVLRAVVDGPLTAEEIASRIAVRKCLEASDTRTLALVQKGVRNYLRRQQNGLIERVQGGDGRVRWRVQAAGEESRASSAGPDGEGRDGRCN